MRCFLTISVSLLICGCTTVLQPIDSSSLKVSKPHQQIQLPELQKPIEYSKNTPVFIPKSIQLPSDENYFNKGAISLKNDKTIIISVPRGAKKRQSEFEAEASNKDSYQSLAYYDKRESFIENALLRQGFDVVDRSRFEAKLRDMRDRTNNDKKIWWDDNLSEAQRKKISFIEAERDNGRMPHEEATRRIMQILGQSEDEHSIAGSSEKDRMEMFDISEVIRAAKAKGDAKADFVLQVNYLDVIESNQVPDSFFSFKNNKIFKEIIASDRDLSWGPIESDFRKSFSSMPSGIRFPGNFAKFSAKLIDVKSGKIVWLGEHTVSSLSAINGFDIDINVRKKSSNATVINNEYEKYKGNLKRSYSDMLNAKNDLTSVYKKYSRPIETAPDQLQSLKNRRDREINNAKTLYIKNKNYYKGLADNSSTVTNYEYKYEHKVTVSLSSDFDSLTKEIEDLEMPERNERNTHIEKLMTEVVKTLIHTIRVQR